MVLISLVMAGPRPAAVGLRVCVAFALIHASLCQNWVNRNPELPSPLGEVTQAYVAGSLFMVGQGKDWTCKFTTMPWASNWNCDLAQRPVPGNHHACVVPGDGTFWLVGGLGSEGLVSVSVVSRDLILGVMKAQFYCVVLNCNILWVFLW